MAVLGPVTTKTGQVEVPCSTVEREQPAAGTISHAALDPARTAEPRAGRRRRGSRLGKERRAVSGAAVGCPERAPPPFPIT